MKLYEIAVLIPLLMAMWCTPATEAAPDDWKELFRDKVARIEVEKAVYEKANRPGFFIHVRITNLTTRTLGIDLSKRQNVIRLNQAGYSRVDYRETTDELRVMGWTLTASEQEALKNAFIARKLHDIDSDGSVDYFIDFNDDGKLNPRDVKDKFFMLVVDGTLFLTDGRQIYRLSLEKLMVEREVPIPSPPQFKTIPDNAIVIGPF